MAVAVSGGRDSLCLLHATLAAARPLGVRVFALHVHHGLLKEADGWLDGLVTRCRDWARAGWPVAFRAARLHGRPAPGDSVEAWARRERYAALGELAREAAASLVLLGHHRRDQAETVLLQALRGGGPAGLAAMPASAARDGLTWARPWLHATDESIDAYAAAHGLVGVVDPSNADPRLDRSRLRRDVMPALRQAFPQAESALAAVAAQAGEARAVLAEIAAQDLHAIGAGDALPFEGWRGLSDARRANALRAWLGARARVGVGVGEGEAVPDSLARRLAREWRGGSEGTWPLDGTRVLRAWRGTLRVVSTARDDGVAPDGAAPAREVFIAQPGVIALPGWGGSLEVLTDTSRGLAPAPAGLRLRACARAGGERFALAPQGTPRALKKQFQAAAVPSWERGGPLLFEGDSADPAASRLVFVPGLGVDARCWAPAGAPQWRLRWVPDVAARAPA